MSKVQPVLNAPEPIARRAVEASRPAVAPPRRPPAGPRLTVVSAGAGFIPAAALIAGRAERFVRANIGRRLRVADLVAATGASEEALRLAIQVQTGQALRDFIFGLRLDQAHAWLSSERELRSLREIAAALGFKYLGNLSRPYVERFGESMTQTRRRAVSASAAPKYRTSILLTSGSDGRVGASRERNVAESPLLK